MKPIPTLCALFSFVCLLLAGCDSGVSARIQEKATVFNTLTPDQQEMIRNGQIEAGFTTDMVYLALGKPSKIHTKQSPDGPITVWTYSRFYPAGPIGRGSLSYEQGMHAVSPNALGTGTSGRFGGTNPGSQSSATSVSSNNVPTTNGPTMAPEPGDLPSDTLFVYFYQDRVIDAKLESQM